MRRQHDLTKKLPTNIPAHPPSYLPISLQRTKKYNLNTFLQWLCTTSFGHCGMFKLSKQFYYHVEGEVILLTPASGSKGQSCRMCIKRDNFNLPKNLEIFKMKTYRAACFEAVRIQTEKNPLRRIFQSTTKYFLRDATSLCFDPFYHLEKIIAIPLKCPRNYIFTHLAFCLKS